jgi:hypothetical protein
MRSARSSLRRLILALPLALGACITWAQRPMPAPQGEQRIAGPVRVTRMKGASILLDSVAIRADSVVGREMAPPHARIAIPSAEVRTVEERRTDGVVIGASIIATLLAGTAIWAGLKLAREGLGGR